MEEFKAGAVERVSNAGLTVLNKTAGALAGVVGGLVAGPVACAPAEGILLILGAPVLAFGLAGFSAIGGAIFGAAHGFKFGVTKMFTSKALEDLEDFKTFGGSGPEVGMERTVSKLQKKRLSLAYSTVAPATLPRQDFKL